MPRPSQEPVLIPRSLPRGRSPLPRKVVLMSQRERLLEAIVAAVAEKGYASTTIADVIGLAGVSRTTFYEQFQDKEDCFVIAYAEGARTHFEQIVEAFDSAQPPLDQFRAAVRRYLEVLVGAPPYARTFLVEVLAAGTAAAGQRQAVHDRHIALATDWHRRLRAERPDLPEPPRAAFEAAVAGVDGLVASWVRAGRGLELQKLEPVIVGFWLSVAGLGDEALMAFSDFQASAQIPV